MSNVSFAIIRQSVTAISSIDGVAFSAVGWTVFAVSLVVNVGFFAFLQSRRCQRNSTNLRLKSLAVSNLLLGNLVLGMDLGQFSSSQLLLPSAAGLFCRFDGFFESLSVVSKSWTLAFVALDRVLRVMTKQPQADNSVTRFATLQMLLMWIVSCAYSARHLVIDDAITLATGGVDSNATEFGCDSSVSDETYTALLLLDTIVEFVLPMAFACGCYVAIITKLSSRSSSVSYKRSIGITIVLMLLFAASFLPHQAMRLLRHATGEAIAAYSVLKLLMLLDSCLNIPVYVLLMQSMRQQLLQCAVSAFGSCCRCQRLRQSQSKTMMASTRQAAKSGGQ